eukprot:TRINITY_DN5872_c0_g1_i1.p1 TRINITY_DN5872_c0_g1~~TRINITY_DN5872_c0_g1_i1.p1  ORF type:complete len:133 (+),score=26.28 TRINITY_DN5872_c0_g1_i1:230-628(+)
MSYQALNTSPLYSHRICGMATPLVQAIRTANGKTEASDSEAIYTTIKRNFSQILSSSSLAGAATLSLGLYVGGALRDYSVLSSQDEDIIIYLLLDVTDIDSKQMTFVKNGAGNTPAIFQLLYKVDASAGVLA